MRCCLLRLRGVERPPPPPQMLSVLPVFMSHRIFSIATYTHSIYTYTDPTDHSVYYIDIFNMQRSTPSSNMANIQKGRAMFQLLLIILFWALVILDIHHHHHYSNSNPTVTAFIPVISPPAFASNHRFTMIHSALDATKMGRSSGTDASPDRDGTATATSTAHIVATTARTTSTKTTTMNMIPATSMSLSSAITILSLISFVVLPSPAVAAMTDSSTIAMSQQQLQLLPQLSPTWNSALLAYGHYFFILLGTILLSYERFTVKANMSVEDEKSLVVADALYGVVGALLAGTGYFRVISEYGKGWEYYAHEPLFWVKLSAAGLLAGLSLFPTLTFIRRGSKLFQNEDIAPMSEALATRVQKVLNAELSAILSVPLMATLMARGVAYNPDFPWSAGAAVTILTLVGSGAYYARQALTWTEPSE